MAYVFCLYLGKGRGRVKVKGDFVFPIAHFSLIPKVPRSMSRCGVLCGVIFEKSEKTIPREELFCEAKEVKKMLPFVPLLPQPLTNL